MSTVIAVRKLVNFMKSAVVRDAQYTSFHGDAYRDVEKLKWTPAYLGLSDIRPLHLIRDGNVVPDIFQPRLGFLFSATVKKLCEPFRNLEFLEIVIDKFVDYRISKGNFSVYDRPVEYDAPSELLRAPELSKERHPNGKWYEVICARHMDIVQKFKSLTDVRFSEKGTNELDAPIYSVSKEMLEQYPMHHYEGWLMLSPELFAKLDRYIDWDFFVEHKLEF